MAHFVYFHGLPGSASDLSFLADTDISTPPVLHPADWGHWHELTGQRNAALVGFSMGAFGAIRAAASCESITSLHLISPAAPLELGDFLQEMAGAAVFRMASKHRSLLRAITLGQTLLNRLLPNLLINKTFAGSPPKDQALLNDTAFRRACLRSFHGTFVDDQQRYLSTIEEYVQPWAKCLNRIDCPVHIYQGTADTWTPPAMAAALAEYLGDRCVLTSLEDLGHYSTLQAVLPKILNEQA